jgi:predicted esterase
METIHLPTTVHGRVLVERTADPIGALVGFHGYAQTAEDMLEQLRSIPATDRWTRVSIQALHPFYSRGDSRVVASWMTRQDRDLAITDNIAYVHAAIAEGCCADARPLVYVGFSQGTAMAYRAALTGASPAAGIVALAGDIPPELKDDASLRWPPVLIGVGDREEWYTGHKLDDDVAFLQSRGITHTLVRFDGGHEWTDEFRVATSRSIASLVERA